MPSSPASSSSSADPAHQPPRISRPHRCNDRVEDVVQVRNNGRKGKFSLFFSIALFRFLNTSTSTSTSTSCSQKKKKKKTPQAFVSLRLDLLRPALSTLVECLRSEPGSEPQSSYQVLKDGGKFLKERVIDSDGKIVDEK